MRDVKLLNGALWVLNLALGAGILAFAWFCLLKPGPGNLQGFTPDDEPTPTNVAARPVHSDDAIKRLENPLRPRQGSSAAGPAAFKAVLKGTLPSEKDPKRGIAFIKAAARNAELVAYMDEEIRDGDKPFEEFRGWKLVEVSKDRATFSDGARKETLVLDLLAAATPAGAAPGSPGAPGGAPGPKTNRSGQAYSGEQFKSRLLAQADTRHVWGLDPDEIDWAVQNSDRILDQDFRVSPSGQGGLRVDSVAAGSIGATRGILAGDVVREVNGQPLSSVGDIKNLLNNPSMRQQQGLRITVERAGKPVVIEYRPLPR
jgi:hypothetical protein